MYATRRALVFIVCLTALAVIGWAVPCVGQPPEDQDAGDGSINECSVLDPFNVPKVPTNQSKPNSPNVNQGWGWLVLLFDRPIEGGAFVFMPECPNPLNGVLNPDDNRVIRLGPGRYGIGETNAPNSGPAGGTFGTFDVTILYDTQGGAPTLISGFWKSKTEDFQFRPQGTVARYDVQLAPEPSTFALWLAGAVLAPALLRRRHSRQARAAGASVANPSK
ncbi:MAG: hypothetical protein ACRD8O_08975 [Bryobacteraceae bacterium]